MKKEIFAILFVFLAFLIVFSVPPSIHHSTGYEAIYTRSVDALHTSFTLGPDLYLAPGMPLFLGFASLFGGPLWTEYARLLQFFLYIILIVLTYHTGRLIFNDSRTGVVGALIMALSPVVFIQIFSFGPDLLYAVALLAGAVLSLRIIRNEGRQVFNAASAGVAFGLAALTDPIGLYVPPLVAIWIIVLLAKRGIGAVRLAALIFVFIIMTGAVITPWYMRNQIVFGGSEVPVVQKVIESQIFTDARTIRLVTYPFAHKPLVVLEKSLQMFLIPPDLDILDANTSVSYRMLATDFLLRGAVPVPRELLILFLKSAVVAVHATLMLLAAAGFFLAFRNPVSYIAPLILGYVLFASIGYGSLSLFEGIAPLNEFLIPLYGIFYALGGYALVRLGDTQF